MGMIVATVEDAVELMLCVSRRVNRRMTTVIEREESESCFTTQQSCCGGKTRKSSYRIITKLKKMRSVISTNPIWRG